VIRAEDIEVVYANSTRALQPTTVEFAADVFAMEDWALADRPAAIEPRLLASPRTFFTPHLGSAVDWVRRAIALRATDNVLDVLAGRPPRDAINQPSAARGAMTSARAGARTPGR
jgi:phosphonate dehydrogenase